jgi:hypothetical protein
MGVLFAIIGIPALCGLLSAIKGAITDAKYEAKKAAREAEEKKELAQTTTEKIADITTYQNSNISNDDIMAFFKSQCISYLGQSNLYTYRYKVYTEADKQNYAWRVITTKHGRYAIKSVSPVSPVTFSWTTSYRWVFYYDITFYFSNGFFEITVSDGYHFEHGGVSPKHYNSVEECWAAIDMALITCQQESCMTWKKYGKVPVYMDKPFSCYFLHPSHANQTTQKTSGSTRKKNTLPPKSPPPPDMLSFYRSLLGLRLNFTKGELKTAYRTLAEKYHPDKYISASSRDRENAETLMKQINGAYEVLKEAV